MVEPYKPIYTVKEAAGVLRVNPTKVYELISTKKLPSLLLGQRKIRGSDLERFIMTYPVAEIEEGGRITALYAAYRAVIPPPSVPRCRPSCL